KTACRYHTGNLLNSTFSALKMQFFQKLKIAGKNGENFPNDYRLKGLEGAWSSPFRPRYHMSMWFGLRVGLSHQPPARSRAPLENLSYPTFFIIFLIGKFSFFNVFENYFC